VPLSVSPEPKSDRNRTDFEVSTPPPSPRSQNRGHPLSGFGSLSEFHQYVTTKQTVTPGESRCFVPTEVSSPFSVYQSRGATYLRRFPPRRLRCTLRVSHPLGALLPSRPSELIPSRYRSWGSTLRGFDPCPAPYALSGAAPFRVFSRLLRKRIAIALPRTLTLSKARRRVWGLTRLPPSDASLGFPAPRFLTLDSEGHSRALSSPLALFRFGRKLTSPLAPQGFSLPRTQPLSLETSEPPCSLSPRYASQRFGDPARLGVWFALEDQPASPRTSTFSSSCCRAPGRSLPRSLYR
jgi:hypothetical protein